LEDSLIGAANDSELSDIHNEAFHLQVVVGSNTERLTDARSGMPASLDEQKHVMLGEYHR
jgi:hypothetical protein